MVIYNAEKAAVTPIEIGASSRATAAASTTLATAQGANSFAPEPGRPMKKPRQKGGAQYAGGQYAVCVHNDGCFFTASCLARV